MIGPLGDHQTSVLGSAAGAKRCRRRPWQCPAPAARQGPGAGSYECRLQLEPLSLELDLLHGIPDPRACSFRMVSGGYSSLGNTSTQPRPGTNPCPCCAATSARPAVSRSLSWHWRT